MTGSGTAGNGYSAGAGGAVTQATINKATEATLNTIGGRDQRLFHHCRCGRGGIVSIHLRNISAGALADALVLNFAVAKSVIA